MELSESKIKEINSMCPEDQGVFFQPWGIPTSIKEHVIYQRFLTGGMTGGSYHENSFLHSFTNDESKPPFRVLDLVLKELKPELTYLQYKDVERLIRTSDYSDREDYYGNCSDYDITYIVLSDLYKYLESI